MTEFIGTHSHLDFCVGVKNENKKPSFFNLKLCYLIVSASTTLLMEDRYQEL